MQLSIKKDCVGAQTTLKIFNVGNSKPPLGTIYKVIFSGQSSAHQDVRLVRYCYTPGKSQTVTRGLSKPVSF